MSSLAKSAPSVSVYVKVSKILIPFAPVGSSVSPPANPKNVNERCAVQACRVLHLAHWAAAGERGRRFGAFYIYISIYFFPPRCDPVGVWVVKEAKKYS